MRDWLGGSHIRREPLGASPVSWIVTPRVKQSSETIRYVAIRLGMDGAQRVLGLGRGYCAASVGRERRDWYNFKTGESEEIAP